jgi:hypothetical protein
MIKLIANYKHDPANLQPIYLAVTNLRTPPTDSWKPAFRDTIDGKRVVWAKFAKRGGVKLNLWLRDSNGDRVVGTVEV